MKDSVAINECAESKIARVADEFLDRLHAGEDPSVQSFVERYPQLAGVLPQVLESLRALRCMGSEGAGEGDRAGAGAGAGADAGADDGLPAGQRRLGDFRLIREIGRGGMGIVYEVEQMSLGRRVALKVLPFAAVLDERQLARFKNEARAAATLHHTNIVPVFSVGCERGVHFYAMQFIEGHTLADVIAAIRGASASPCATGSASAPSFPSSAWERTHGEAPLRENDSDMARSPDRAIAPTEGLPSHVDARSGASARAGSQAELGNQGNRDPAPTEAHPSPRIPSLPSSAWQRTRTEAPLREILSASPDGDARSGASASAGSQAELGNQGVSSPDTLHAAATTIVTERSSNSPAFYRTVARLGIQAAEGLEHAHQHGVIHRDIKPANLMVDTTGNLWITDFGLARLETDAGITMTGDLVGTLRYMSPEQALGKPTSVDHRTDVYSLGATLYELLTHRAPFDSENRAKLLRQVAFDEPPRLRRNGRDIPIELETIVLKTLAKNPDERYGAAQEMADDLRRYLDNKPIRARRPSLFDRAWKWTNRHKALATMALVSTMIVMTVVIVASFIVLQQRADALADEAHRRQIAEWTIQAQDDYRHFHWSQANWTSAQPLLVRAITTLRRVNQYEPDNLNLRVRYLEWNYIHMLRLEANGFQAKAREILGELASDLVRDNLARKLDESDLDELAKVELSHVLGACTFHTAERFVQQQKLETAAAVFERAAETYSVAAPRLQGARARALIAMAECLEKLGKAHGAHTAYRDARAVLDDDRRLYAGPNYPHMYGPSNQYPSIVWDLHGATVCLRLGDSTRAAKYFISAVADFESDKPTNSAILALVRDTASLLGVVEYAGILKDHPADLSARPGKLLQRFRHIQGLDKAMAKLFLAHGNSLFEKGQRKRACDSFQQHKQCQERYASSHPNDYSARTALAMFLVTCSIPELRDAKVAVRLARQAQNIKPDSSSALRALSVAYYRLGDVAESVRQFNPLCQYD